MVNLLYRSRIATPACLGLIGAIWLLAISVSLPLGVYMEIKWLEEEAINICEEHWPFTSARKFFTVCNFALQYIVPCGVISYCYTRVSVTLRMRARLKITTGRSNNSERHALEINRKRRTNRMLIAMVVIFVVCWLPLNVIHLTLEYYEELEQWSCFLLAFFIAHVIAMSSTIYNPFLYAWMNDNFRSEFRRVIPCEYFRGHMVRRNSSLSGVYSAVAVSKMSMKRREPKLDEIKEFGADQDMLIGPIKIGNVQYLPTRMTEIPLEANDLDNGEKIKCLHNELMT